jgi:hypothetical protein
MARKQWTPAELQAKLEQQAADGDAGARATLWVQRRREAGLTRQMTGAECVDPARIAALYANDPRFARFGR